MTRRLALAVLPLTALLLAGCGGGWGSASGSVTLDGTPLKDGIITFHPVGGGPTAYGIVTDGAFTIATGQQSGLSTGKYKVTVSASSIPKEGTNETAKLLTPAKYSKADTTDLEATVNGGLNSYTFEMKSK